ncbi:MAG: glycosyltransferase family 4 protein [Gemmatimonadaceae bacterium]
MAIARPVLAVVSARPAGDGVGYAGLLLARALAEIAGAPPRVIGLEPRIAGRVSRREQLTFLARLTLAQWTAPPLPVVFNHMGIARAQLHVPAAMRRPYAVFLHGVEIWDPELAADRKDAIRRARVRMSNSFYTARRVARVHPDLGPISACPLALLPDGPAPNAADVAEAMRLLGGGDRPRAIIVGRMSSTERYKGHDELIECWPRLRAAVPNAQLLVVGRGDDVPRLGAKAAAAGVAGDIVFTGFVANGVLRALLERCNVFAMPSRGEGFGLAYLEAMRRGLPCIGSDADAAPDVIADGTTGCIVKDGDREALAVAIGGLLANPQRATAMGEAGRRREREVFSFAAFRGHVAAALGPAER